MFLHHLKYAFKGIIRERNGIFWACLFPFVLGTLFNVCFGHIYERSEQVHEIKTAVVREETAQNVEVFVQILKKINNDSGDKLFDVKEMSIDEAEKQLENEKIDGYYVVGSDISLHIKENGMNQTIQSVFLDNYIQQASIIEETAASKPEKLQTVIQELQKEHMFYTKVNETKGNMDNVVQYFYSLIAMSCLFGSFLSIDRAKKLQANLSALGMRRGVAASKKSMAILAEFLVCLTIQLVIGCLLFAYLINICGINMGERIGYMILVYAVGSAFGVSMGVFLGSLGRISEAVRVALNLGFSLGSCFLSGLMVGGIKQVIEDHAPIVNRLNPASLITDALYSLDVFDNLNRYYLNMAILTALTVILCFAAIMQTRRLKYADL